MSIISLTRLRTSSAFSLPSLSQQPDPTRRTNKTGTSTRSFGSLKHEQVVWRQETILARLKRSSSATELRPSNTSPRTTRTATRGSPGERGPRIHQQTTQRGLILHHTSHAPTCQHSSHSSATEVTTRRRTSNLGKKFDNKELNLIFTTPRQIMPPPPLLSPTPHRHSKSIPLLSPTHSASEPSPLLPPAHSSLALGHLGTKATQRLALQSNISYANCT
jgi:hypothetical protein